MSQKQKTEVTSNTPTNALFVPDYSGNYSQIERESYQDSPVQICTVQHEKDKPEYFAALGNKRLTFMFDTKEKLIEHMQKMQFLHLLMTATFTDMQQYHNNAKATDSSL